MVGQGEDQSRGERRADRRDAELLELTQARARRRAGHLAVRLPYRLPLLPPGGEPGPALASTK